MALTKRQEEYIQFALSIIRDENRTPSYAEIGRHFGTQRSTVYGSVGKLLDFASAKKEKGNCPLCGQALARYEQPLDKN